MIVVLKHNPNPEQLQSLITWLQEKGIIIHTSIGEGNMLLGLVGDTSKIDADLISALDIVEDVKRVQEPYKNANRKFHPEDTVVKVGNTQIGGGNLTLMAGPCSVESEEQVVAIAKAVKASGATMLRGGAFKPRTSPYSFQGLGEVGLRYLEIAKEETGLPIVTELMDLSQLPLFKNVDVIQIGARNMQNFDLLKAVGRQEKPVMIKRGMSATYEEWLMSAEYIMAGGNENVIPATRWTCPPCRSSRKRPTCPSSSTPATPPARAGWSTRWRWARWRPAATACSSRSTTTLRTRCATVRSP